MANGHSLLHNQIIKQLFSKEIRETVDCCHILYRQGYVYGGQGNVSHRIEDDKFLITPSGYSLRDITPDNLCLVNFDGNNISGNALTPSSEYLMHLGIYKQRGDVNAIIHTHPLEVVLYFNHEDKHLSLPNGEYIKKDTKKISYIPPGSDELAKEVANQSTKTDSIILCKHGLVTMGENIRKAADLTGIIVYYSKYEVMNELWNKL